MYKCMFPFTIANTSIYYPKHKIIGSEEFNGLPYGYQHFFKPYDEETSRNNARPVSEVFIANKIV